MRLPSWVDDSRLTDQLEAAEEIVEHFCAGVPVVFLDSPPGNGKTLIAEIVRQMLVGIGPQMGWQTRRPGKHKTVYTCTDKELQRQVQRDFPHANVLYGRGNYDSGTEDVTCDACTKRPGTGCRWCESWWDCSYQRAKRAAAAGELAVTNLAYLLREANSGPRSVMGQRDFIILDEVDLCEGWLRNTVEVNVSAWMRRRLGIGVPKHKTVAGSWQTWIDAELLPAVVERLTELSNVEDPRAVKERKTLERLFENLRNIDVGTNWVYDGYQGNKNGKHPVIFRPIHVDGFARPMLWRHAPRIMAMSGTIISATQMAVDLGLEDHEWACVRMDSPFDPARSPIQVRPVADMSRRADEKVALGDELRRVVAERQGQRILVHTVSYMLTAFLQGYLTSDRIVSYDSAKTKEDALRRYRERSDAVMLAPSLDRGISLDDDLARVVIVAKVPFASLGDKQVAARLYSRGGDTWYAVEAVRTLVQALYRGTRSKEDWALGMILDRQFISNIWAKNRGLLPGWFKKRLDMTGRKEPVRD